MEIRTYEPTNHRVRMLVYGASGIGKTVFGATAPKPLFLAVEEGLLSLSDKGIQYAKVRSLQDMRDILAALKNNKITGADGKPIEYETIVIDSLTEVQQVVIQNITGGRMPSMKQWGDFSDRMAEILKGFCALDKHVIFTCLESEKTDEDDDGREFSRFQPELFGKLTEKACAMMDFVGRYYMKVEVVNDKPTHKRVLTFTISPRWRAKDRSGKMPQFADPDFSKLMSEFAKIKIGEGEAVGSVASGMEAPKLTFPPEPRDKPSTPEQSSEIKEAWKHYMSLYRGPDGYGIPEANWDATLASTMKKHCGVVSTKDLKKKQADGFFGMILDKIQEAEKKNDVEDEGMADAGKANEEGQNAPDSATAKDPEEAEAHSKREAEYDVMADLDRRKELDELSRDALESVAEGYEIKVTAKMNRGEIIDAIIEKEFPNAPKKAE